MKNLSLSSNLFILFLFFSKSINAQVPVFEEPRHKVVLLNEYIRLIDVHIPPHDTTLYHRHSTPSVIVFLSKNITGSQIMGGETATGEAIPGNTLFADFGNKPVSHRVWNQDTVVYHVMDIEILPRNNSLACAAINEPSTKLAWEKKNIRVYNIYIGAGKTSIIKGVNCPHLLIMISGLASTTSADMLQQSFDQLKPGDFKWYTQGSGFEIKNNGPVDADCVLLELK